MSRAPRFFTQEQISKRIKSGRGQGMGKALLHKDLKVKTSHIYSNLSDNSGMWSA